MMKENSDATSVFWDINRCPIPNGFDARWVRPSIKRFLRNLGYTGPLTVTAVGVLSGVPFDILEGVYSSGICLANVRNSPVSVGADVMLTDKNPPPANIMVISDPRTFPCFSGLLEAQGYNIVPCDSLHSFFHPDSCALEAVESAWWECFICPHDPPEQGFDNFTKHLASEEHHQMEFPKVTRMNVVGLPMAPLDPRPPIATNLMEYLHPPMEEWLPPKNLVLQPDGSRKICFLEEATSVFWDLNACPLPLHCDAHRAGPCIKRFLESLGYSGPLTITAAGVLADVPIETLRGLYSSGISLTNVPYGSADVSRLISESKNLNRPPANIMLISNERTFFSCLSVTLQSMGYNLIQPFPYPSVESLFLTGEHEKDKYSETSESARWFCKVCFPGFTFQGFDNLTTHLQSSEHKQKVSDHPPMNIRLKYRFAPLRDFHDLKAVTVVFWDINMCPIPTGVDARWVRPRIKQFLEKSGYSGPLTITAVGALKDVPNGILGELFSSGISLDNVAYGSSSIGDLIFQFQVMNPPPANIMVISDPKIFPSENSDWLQSSGYNLIQPYPFDSLQNFLPTDSGELDCSELGESASWVCSVCRSPPGQVFENFTTHLSSQVHERKTLGCRPRD